MSSHHIVRESQEPALWIMQPQACDYAFIQELLEWSPWVLVSEAALTDVLGWGVKIDAVLLQESGNELWLEKLQEQTPLEIIVYQQDSLQSGLDHLLQKQVHTVHVVAEPIFAENFHFDHTGIEWVLFYEDFKMIFYLESVWKKWVPQGQLFYLPEKNLQTSNLQILKDKPGFYEAIQDGFVEICTPEVGFWLSEKLN
ncbi:MAG: hypothetical protein NW226_07285 [Microscillaceae bacterium]|nr:hypothetical protein [Microscillaceae bacterium]